MSSCRCSTESVSPTEFTGFEREAGFETRERSYGGLIPASFRFGPARDHHLGGSAAGGADGVVLLGCSDCGEWGCWPLVAEVVVDDGTIIWQSFEQPHRRDRDYSAFGPFDFDRLDYQRAVAALAPRSAMAPQPDD